MTQSIEQFAAEHKLDENSLRSLVGFLTRHIGGNETLKAAFFANPEEVIKAGVEAWNKQSQAIFAELLDGRSEWAQATKVVLAEATWIEARQKAGKPLE